MNRNRRYREPVIFESYADADLARPCPNCGARPDSWCTNEVTGRVRRVPCLARTTATTLESAE